MKSKIYKALSVSNDVKAVSKGRILQRFFNKKLLKTIRKYFK